MHSINHARASWERLTVEEKQLMEPITRAVLRALEDAPDELSLARRVVYLRELAGRWPGPG